MTAEITNVTQAASDVASQTQATEQAGSWTGLLVYCLLAFAIIYFFMVRPNKKRMTEYQKMLDSIKVGDRILAAGIYGKVKKVNDKTIELEIAKGVVIEVSKNAVVNVEK
ncbi:MAG: preprotein translocase subunit YajC [Alphaproteobacteria bacterium]|nr:preprotein translocase subunit YajC [Alphaproteobacteria bacterium]